MIYGLFSGPGMRRVAMNFIILSYYILSKLERKKIKVFKKIQQVIFRFLYLCHDFQVVVEDSKIRGK